MKTSRRISRSYSWLLAVAACVASCGDSHPVPEKVAPVPLGAVPTLPADKGDEWMAYYQSQVPSFSLKGFHLKDTSSLTVIPGNVHGSFDPEFDPIYANFLLFSPDKKRYLDIDSYQWSLGKDQEIASAPDQEINLVDLKAQTVERIAFRGPSQWVEDACWKSNSVVCLLENSSEGTPTITEIDLAAGTIRTYVYNDPLPFKSKYSSLRIKRLSGLKEVQ